MPYDPNDDPAEAFRKAVEARTAIARVPAPPPRKISVEVVRVVSRGAPAAEASFEPPSPDEMTERERRAWRKMQAELENEAEAAPKAKAKTKAKAKGEGDKESWQDLLGVDDIEDHAAEEIASFLDDGADVLREVGQSLRQEGGLARKQLHSLIDEGIHTASTVFDLILNPEKLSK